MIFMKGTNYQQTFTEEVDRLLKSQPLPTAEERSQISNQLIEEYFTAIEETPPAKELSRLTDWILRDSTNNPDKVTTEEYPIFTELTSWRRGNREWSDGNIEHRTVSTQHKIQGKRKPKQFRTFGEYGGN